MKKLLTLSLLIVPLLAFRVADAQAQLRSPQQARTLAARFLESHGQPAGTLVRMEAAGGGRTMRKIAPESPSAATAAPYYLFAAGETGRTVIVSGDGRMPEILGYSDRGAERGASAQPLPDGLRALLAAYAAEYEALRQGKEIRRAAPHQGQRLLRTAPWGQWAPYNNDCPRRYPTGCAATAMAIVMKYHEWPQQGQGSNRYQWQDSVIAADFTRSAYAWDKMRDDYSGAYAAEEAAAVARLMKDAGVAVNMNYAAESSGASQSLVPTALARHFGYAPAARLAYSQNYDTEAWHALLRAEIDGGRPVIYTGDSHLGRGAHGFVLDGYNGNFFHFNFGWNGSGNGYYAVSDLMGDSDGFEFSYSQNAVVGITPERGQATAPLTLRAAGGWPGYVTALTALTASRAESVEVGEVTAARDWRGTCALALYSGTGTLRSVLAAKRLNLNSGEAAAVGTYDFVTQLTAEAGDRIALVARESDDGEWAAVANSQGEAVSFPATGRAVPLTALTLRLRDTETDDTGLGNRTDGGKPLTGSAYAFKVKAAAGAEKTIVRADGVTLTPESTTADGTAIYRTGRLTAAQAVIEAKAYKAGETLASVTAEDIAAGTLEARLGELSDGDADRIDGLTVKGTLNGEDLACLGRLATLKSINMEETALALGEGMTPNGLYGAAFRDFKRLTECRLPRGLAKIGSELFAGCGRLRSVTIPVGVTRTGGRLFAGCGSLTDLYVYPANPGFVGAEAFGGLPSPAQVTVHVQQGLRAAYQGNAQWSAFTSFSDDLDPLPAKFTADGIQYKASYTGAGNTARVAIPYDRMYQGDIVIPAEVSYQGYVYRVTGFENDGGLSPFVGNPLVTSVDMRFTLDTLDYGMFMGCTALAGVKMPKGLRHIAGECFRNCPLLARVELPATLEKLGDGAFHGCQSLTDVYCQAATPPEGSNGEGTHPFAQCPVARATLHVPAAALPLYQAAGYWSRFGNYEGDAETGITAPAAQGRGFALPAKVTGGETEVSLPRPATVGVYTPQGVKVMSVKLPRGKSVLRLPAEGVFLLRAQ